jgi:hypothetical protein
MSFAVSVPPSSLAKSASKADRWLLREARLQGRAEFVGQTVDPLLKPDHLGSHIYNFETKALSY